MTASFWRRQMWCCPVVSDLAVSSEKHKSLSRARMHKRIHKVAVLGAGTMGARIAAHLANAGVPCYLLDIVPPDAAGSNDRTNPNSIPAAGLQPATKSNPAAFFHPSL